VGPGQHLTPQGLHALRLAGAGERGARLVDAVSKDDRHADAVRPEHLARRPPHRPARAEVEEGGREGGQEGGNPHRLGEPLCAVGARWVKLLRRHLQLALLRRRPERAEVCGGLPAPADLRTNMRREVTAGARWPARARQADGRAGGRAGGGAPSASVARARRSARAGSRSAPRAPRRGRRSAARPPRRAGQARWSPAPPPTPPRTTPAHPRGGGPVRRTM